MAGRMLRNALLVLGAIIVSAAICVVALILLMGVTERGQNRDNRFADVAAATLMRELTEKNGGYTLSDAGKRRLSDNSAWAMLLDETGKVVWNEKKPADVADRFTPADVASFTRWYLGDYPVSVWRDGDKLLVVGDAKGSVWKYLLTFRNDEIDAIGVFFPLVFLALLIVLLLLGRFSFRREQMQRDSARSRWIDGVSHDIRTPLSIVMGYAGGWAADETLPETQRKQAAAMVAACESVKTLVADLNLTMRLDYEMQPLRRETVSAASLLRAAAAEALNSGLVPDIELNIPPEAEGLYLNADPVLLHRALMNLLQNAVRHGGDGIVTMQLTSAKKSCCIRIENPCAENAEVLLKRLNRTKAAPAIARDGSAAHGTGLRLVEQVTKAHRGRLRFTTVPGSARLRAELRLPTARR